MKLGKLLVELTRPDESEHEYELHKKKVQFSTTVGGPLLDVLSIYLSDDKKTIIVDLGSD